MAETIYNSTPARDGFHMPAEFEPQERVWMLWPQRPDNWRDGAKPAQEAYTEVAKAISRFVPVTMCVNGDQYKTPERSCRPIFRWWRCPAMMHGCGIWDLLLW